MIIKIWTIYIKTKVDVTPTITAKVLHTTYVIRIWSFKVNLKCFAKA